MINRAAWKRMKQQATEGLPPGDRGVCRCGGLLVFEQREESVILHHAQPWCERFQVLCQQAKFVTLAKSTPSEVRAAIAMAEHTHGSHS